MIYANPSRVVIFFGPEHAPLEQRQVALAIEEAQNLVPKPKIIVFASFQFDPEASKDIDETDWPGVILLKAQMNTDLLTDDLKKKRTSNDAFWLIGQPEVTVVSGEFLVLSINKLTRLCHYETFKKLSGLNCLEEVRKLSREDLLYYTILSQGRDVWNYLSDEEGWDFRAGKYCGRPGKKQNRRVPPVSWNSQRLTGGIRDFSHNLKEFGISNERECYDIIERLRRDRKVIGRIKEIAKNLKCPAQDLPLNSENLKLKTQNFFQVETLGFDYYNTKTGTIDSGSADRIALWMLDTNYDGRSLLPTQVFFPMAGEKEGWARLARNLKAEIDEELIEAYRGTVSLPFEAGDKKRIAVKIVDDRGIESLKIMELG